MAGRQKRSKRQSGASSRSKPPEPVFFLDENLGNHAVYNALKAAGATVERFSDHFPRGMKDEPLLAAVGARNWVFLSKDNNIRRNPLELAALLNARLKSFFLVSAGLLGDEQAQAFVAALKRMRRLAQHRPGPFIARITKTGNVQVLDLPRYLTSSK
jgi:PIN like domain